MTQPDAQPLGGAPPDFKVFLELISKSAALIIGITYFLGLLVTNSYLRAYGISFLGFFALQYVAAGVWALYPVAVGVGIWFLFAAPLRWSTHPDTWRRRLDNAWRLVAATLFVSAFGFTPLFLLEISFDRPRTWIYWLIVFAFTTFFTQPKSWRGGLFPESIWRSREHRAPYLGLIGFLGLFITIMYAQFFANAYRTIPARWGGGGDVGVHLTFKAPPDSVLLRAYGFSFDSIGLRGRLLVLTEQQLLIIADSSRHPLLIARDQVVLLGMDRDCRAVRDRRCRE